MGFDSTLKGFRLEQIFILNTIDYRIEPMIEVLLYFVLCKQYHIVQQISSEETDVGGTTKREVNGIGRGHTGSRDRYSDLELEPAEMSLWLWSQVTFLIEHGRVYRVRLDRRQLKLSTARTRKASDGEVFHSQFTRDD